LCITQLWPLKPFALLLLFLLLLLHRVCFNTATLIRPRLFLLWLLISCCCGCITGLHIINLKFSWTPTCGRLLLVLLLLCLLLLLLLLLFVCLHLLTCCLLLLLFILLRLLLGCSGG
jgi:hypothetical protein